MQLCIERNIWAADSKDVADSIENNLGLDISQPTKNISARWIQIMGWKGTRNFANRGHLMVLFTILFFTIDASKTMFAQNGMNTPDQVTLEQILHIIDSIFELGRETWALMAGES